MLTGADAETATNLLDRVNSALTAMSAGGSMSGGVAELRDGESSVDLVRRADLALHTTRGAEH